MSVNGRPNGNGNRPYARARRRTRPSESPAPVPVYTWPTTDGRTPDAESGVPRFQREENRDLAIALALTNLNAADVCDEDAVLRDLSRRAAEAREHSISEALERERAHLRGAQKVVRTREEEERRRRERLAPLIEEELAKAHKLREDATAKDRERATYSLARRSYGRASDVHKLILAVVAGVDIALIGLALMVLPGTDVQHWLTALFIGAVFAAFGHVVGELVAATVRKLRDASLSQQLLFALVGLLLFGGVLIGVALASMTAFRNFGLAEQAASRLLPPAFLGWIQAVAVFVASLSAALWRYGADGRERHGEAVRAMEGARKAEAAASSLRAEIERSYTTEYGYKAEAVAAAEKEGVLDARGEAARLHERKQAEYLWTWARGLFQGARFRIQALVELAAEAGLVFSGRNRKRHAALVAGLVGLATAIAVHLAGHLGHLPSAGLGLVAGGVAYFLGLHTETPPEPMLWPPERPTPEADNREVRAQAAGSLPTAPLPSMNEGQR